MSKMAVGSHLQIALDAKIRAATPTLNAVSNEAARVWAQALGNALGKAHLPENTTLTATKGPPAASSCALYACARKRGRRPKHTAVQSSSSVSVNDSRSSSDNITPDKQLQSSHERCAGGAAAAGIQRRRAPKFAPSEIDTETIFKQIRTNVPWSQSRRSVSGIWTHHLQALHEAGKAVECTKVRTFAAWAAKTCKDRKARRIQEARGAGGAHVKPSAADVIDEVTHRWECYKLGGSEYMNPFAAVIKGQMGLLTQPSGSVSRVASPDLAAKVPRPSSDPVITPFRISHDDLKSVSSQTLGDEIEAISPEYIGYSALFVRSGFDGTLLFDVVDVADLQQLVCDIGIQNKVHQRRVMVQLRQVRARYW